MPGPEHAVSPGRPLVLRAAPTSAARGRGPANLADILERVLDKGIVIAGDIQINLLDIELLTIKIRLLITSVDRAQEMGINWWERDPALSVGAPRSSSPRTRSCASGSTAWNGRSGWPAETSRSREQRPW